MKDSFHTDSVYKRHELVRSYGPNDWISFCKENTYNDICDCRSILLSFLQDSDSYVGWPQWPLKTHFVDTSWLRIFWKLTRNLLIINIHTYFLLNWLFLSFYQCLKGLWLHLTERKNTLHSDKAKKRDNLNGQSDPKHGFTALNFNAII